MLNKVLKTIEKYNMVSKGDSVTVALSGGADSVALLLALLNLKDVLGISIDACHVNHNLRGAEAKRDENFCVELCKRLGININVASIDVISKCKADKLSTEMAARELRYEALNSFAKGKIATAHTLSDSLETSIFNFTRGTGLKGLAGISPVRDNIIRPLIDVSRQEIEEFLNCQGQSFVNDSTNFETVYSRNKIRNIVIPVLREINPSCILTYEKNREMLNEEADYLEDMAAKAFEKAANVDGSLSCQSLLQVHTAIRKRVIFNYFKLNSASLDNKKVKLIEDMLSSGGEVEIKENLYAHIRQGKLSLLNKNNQAENSKEAVIDDKNETNINFGKKIVNITPLTSEELKFSVNLGKKAFKNILDCDKINFNIVIRTRKSGDSMEIYGRNVSKSLKKLFNECKILPSLRDELVILESDGKIAFLEDFGCASWCAPDENTKNAVKINIGKL